MPRKTRIDAPGALHHIIVRGIVTKGPPLSFSNPKQARKDAQDREAIIKFLEEQLKSGAKKLIGNKGYRKYLKGDRGSISIVMKKVGEEARFDGKWVLRTNTDLSAEKIALKYKELWQVEHTFRDMKSTFDTRPVFVPPSAQADILPSHAPWDGGYGPRDIAHLTAMQQPVENGRCDRLIAEQLLPVAKALIGS